MEQALQSKQFSRMCHRFQGAFEILGKRWSGLILRSLLTEPRRFSDISRYIKSGLSDRMLSQRLSELESEGIVERKVYANQKPVRVEYVLTEKGQALRPVFEAIQSWADDWVPDADQPG